MTQLIATWRSRRRGPPLGCLDHPRRLADCRAGEPFLTWVRSVRGGACRPPGPLSLGDRAGKGIPTRGRTRGSGDRDRR
jgi:hypothetical protein